MENDMGKGADAVTLGEKLLARTALDPPKPDWLHHIVYVVLNAAVWAAVLGQVLWLILIGSGDGSAVWYGLAACAVMWGVLAVWGRSRLVRAPVAPHFLLAHDRQQFMANLRLDAKSTVLDGSNIYHFGVDENIGGDGLRLIARQLRAEGYRIVCFFDANIFYRLIEFGDFAPSKPHTLNVLMDVFGLMRDEIYVVPAGGPADTFVLSTLTHLPISFAVTNDQFRDHAKVYGAVMKGDQWRKGLSVKNGELKLYKFRFQTPVRLNRAVG